MGEAGSSEDRRPAREAPEPAGVPGTRVLTRLQGSDYAPPSGAIGRINANLRAIEIAKAGGPQDDDELRELARWSGWGAVPQLFEAGSELAERFGPKLTELLDADEMALASATTPNAHYTSPMVAEAIWALAAKLGFEHGAVIEPGCGAGVFMATAPDGARVTGVEKDTTTAAICAAAHPAHTVVAADLADVSLPGQFDLAVGNVPFSGIVKPYDPVLSADRTLNLHNYALAKALHSLRPGGLCIAVTSTGTLDAASPAQRARLGQLGVFLGAIRLPSGAFERQSGTGVTTDIVVFQRRGHDGDGPTPNAAQIDAENSEAMARWRDTVEAVRRDGGPFMKPARTTDDGTKLPPEPHSHNRWYADHPDMVLGDWESGGLYAADQLIVRHSGDDLAADLAAAVDRLAGRIELARPGGAPPPPPGRGRHPGVGPPPGG
ncbi:MAG: class I SAM-dependent methyltransferase, partial [Acidimicrobiia bacterium]|nr:class I SAM-dependent methyltransferase [Acidimicrobiia bacterium]